ncbi:MAG: PfkB family carbohydrate kinase [Rhodospirillales bacterium]
MAVLVFGAINLDLTVRVARLPGPGETALGAAGLETAPGGKGANQALAARRAGGASVRLVARVGRDAFAAPALALLESEGVDISRVERADAATGVALIAVSDSGENQIAVAPGANAGLSAAAVPEDWLDPATVLSLTLEVPAAEVLALARRAAAKGARVVLNAAPALPVSPALLDLVNVLIVNRHEAPALAAALGFEPGPAVEAARRLSRGRKAAVVVTLGDEGAVAFRGAKAWHVPALKLDRVVDTTGAGDAFAGALAAALDAGMDLAPALARASAAGALACARAGAQPAMPGAREIDQALTRLAPVRRVDLEMN